MKIPRAFFPVLLLGFGAPRLPADAVTPAAAATIVLDWQTDFAAAVAQAKAENKVVVINFTGSDWCVWCHRLRDEVFLTKPFADFSRDQAVIVELDFPRETELPAELKKQNDALAAKYDVRGYPTVLVLSSDGELKGRLGYMQGGPKTFIREVKRMAARSPKS